MQGSTCRAWEEVTYVGWWSLQDNHKCGGVQEEAASYELQAARRSVVHEACAYLVGGQHYRQQEQPAGKGIPESGGKSEPRSLVQLFINNESGWRDNDHCGDDAGRVAIKPYRLQKMGKHVQGKASEHCSIQEQPCPLRF